MHFHGSNYKTMHALMSPSHLPADYGGELPKINYTGKEWYPAVEEIEDHIRKWGTYGFASSN